MNKILIKAVILPKYAVELWENDKGQYVISSRKDDVTLHNRPLRDLGIASRAFDYTLEQLEGN